MSRTAAEAFDFLGKKSLELKVDKVCDSIFSDGRFIDWTGSSKPNLHHYGRGGLVIHTAEVAELCLMNNQILGAGIPEDELFLAAFFHDVAKMEDYAPVNGSLADWTITEHRILIHHIQGSMMYWVSLTNKFPQFLHMQARVIHAILAHHGRKEWGSPVEPRTKMAHLLHHCDAISARMNDADKNPIIKEHP